MTIYVDEMKQYHSGRWCHLMSDQDDLTELHAMATRCGLRRGYFQGRDPRKPHYDLKETKRIQAVSLGAIEVSTREMVRLCIIKKGVKRERKTVVE